jgi:hypothetical protein
MALFPLQRKSCYRFLSPLKIHCPRLCLNIWILGPMASTVATRPPRLTWGIFLNYSNIGPFFFWQFLLLSLCAVYCHSCDLRLRHAGRNQCYCCYCICLGNVQYTLHENFCLLVLYILRAKSDTVIDKHHYYYQVGSCWPLIAEAQVHVHVNPLSDLWWTKWYRDSFFSKFFTFPLCQYHLTLTLYSYIIWGMNNRPVGGYSSETYILTPLTWTKTKKALFALSWDSSGNFSFLLMMCYYLLIVEVIICWL